jgi:hypothetical protein
MTRAELHELVDRLSDDEIVRAEFYLRLIEAPSEEEAATEDDRAAIAEAAQAKGVGADTRWVPGYFR